MWGIWISDALALANEIMGWRIPDGEWTCYYDNLMMIMCNKKSCKTATWPCLCIAVCGDFGR